MTLEATMFIVDNSEWTRNGDFTPTRLDAQKDAINLLATAKTQSNPESCVGLMSLTGKTPEVLATLTPDVGKIITSVFSVAVDGHPNISTAIQIAQLALKHRQNKNLRQRIVAFIASPIKADQAALVSLAKKLKKNNVAVDIINFGEDAENTAKLEAFISTVNSSDNSHLVTIPPGPHYLSDMLLSSPIVMGDNVGASGGAGGGSGGGGAYEFGVDPNLDPELALALRLSMQENAQASTASEGSASAPLVHAAEQDEEALLAQALAMSMTEAQSMDVDHDVSSHGKVPETKKAAHDPAYMMSVLGNLPGVDPNDAAFQNAVKGLATPSPTPAPAQSTSSSQNQPTGASNSSPKKAEPTATKKPEDKDKKKDDKKQ